MFFHISKNDKVQSKNCQNCIPFLESTYPEMQRKHIPRVYVNHEQVASRLMIDIKHQPDRVLLTFDIKNQQDAILVDV